MSINQRSRRIMERLGRFRFTHRNHRRKPRSSLRVGRSWRRDRKCAEPDRTPTPQPAGGKINRADDTTGQRCFAIDTYTDFEANPEGSIRSTYDSGSIKVRRKGDQTT